jgi:abortive infection bacteriophage resistance protein
MEAYQASFFMTIRQPFTKPPLPIKDQITLLQSRGIQISDKEMASHYLQSIGYFRLSGYAHYFRTKEDKYREGTSFEAIMDHYIFDRKLRMLLFDSIERIEVALRSFITSVMTERHGAFWFTKEELFVTNIGSRELNGFKIVSQAIQEATIEQKNKDTFLKHYYDTYSLPELPPSWVVMETLSMGVVSRVFSLLQVEERKAIADLFKTKERHLVSWMRSLTYTRNLCAHHARVWNRVFTLKVEADKRYAICREESFQSGKLYSHTAVISILLKVISPDNNWEQHIKDLFLTFTHKYAQDMGFPAGWNGFNLTK